MADMSFGQSERAAISDGNDDRDFSKFSDHVTVWVDEFIGDGESCPNLREQFDKNVQVLRSNTEAEKEIDDETFLCGDKDMLKKLSDEVYCLKYFPTPEKGLQYITANQNKRIFFISSGTIGKIIVPQIAELPQIQGIYIFCGYISAHTSWAGKYDEQISAMLEHQDNLLERLTRDIALYLEGKGDHYKTEDETMKAKNCYSWAKKLLLRGQILGGTGLTKLINRMTEKIEQAQSSVVCKD